MTLDSNYYYDVMQLWREVPSVLYIPRSVRTLHTQKQTKQINLKQNCIQTRSQRAPLIQHSNSTSFPNSAKVNNTLHGRHGTQEKPNYSTKMHNRQTQTRAQHRTYCVQRSQQRVAKNANLLLYVWWFDVMDTCMCVCVLAVCEKARIQTLIN